MIAVLDQQPSPAGHRELRGIGAVIRSDDDLLEPVAVLDLHAPGGFGDWRLALGLAGLEELDHTWQALSDVVTSHTAGVESPHRQRGTRLPNGRRCRDANRLADIHQLAPGQRTAIAHSTGATRSLAGQDAAYFDRGDAAVREQPDIDITKINPSLQ